MAYCVVHTILLVHSKNDQANAVEQVPPTISQGSAFTV